MAEEDKVDDIEVSEEGGKKSKKLLIIIVAVVLALAGAGAWFFLGSSEDADSVEGDGSEEVVEKQAAIYATFEKAFVVNFTDQSNNAARYLQIKLKVMARDQAVIDAFTLHTPAIQHELLMLFFGQKYDVLNTEEGKQALKEETLITINKVLKAEETEGELEAVYITSLIMQ